MAQFFEMFVVFGSGYRQNYMLTPPNKDDVVRQIEDGSGNYIKSFVVGNDTIENKQLYIKKSEIASMWFIDRNRVPD